MARVPATSRPVGMRLEVLEIVGENRDVLGRRGDEPERIQTAVRVRIRRIRNRDAGLLQAVDLLAGDLDVVRVVVDPVPGSNHRPSVVQVPREARPRTPVVLVAAAVEIDERKLQVGASGREVLRIIEIQSFILDADLTVVPETERQRQVRHRSPFVLSVHAPHRIRRVARELQEMSRKLLHGAGCRDKGREVGRVERLIGAERPGADGGRLSPSNERLWKSPPAFHVCRPSEIVRSSLISRDRCVV